PPHPDPHSFPTRRSSDLISLDSMIDPVSGAPETNTANTAHWPDLIVRVMQNSAQLNTLPLAEGFSEQQYSAAIQGIATWKQLEKDRKSTRLNSSHVAISY